MARRLFSATKPLFHSSRTLTPNPKPNSLLPHVASILPLLPCKRRKKLLKKLSSPRVAPIQKDPSLRNLPFLDSIVDKDLAFRFLNRTKTYLSSLPSPLLPLPQAGTMYRELGFPRGRKVSKYAFNHPLLFQINIINSTPHLAFTPLMESLIEEEKKIFDSVEEQTVITVRKLLMIFNKNRVPLAKLHHCRAVFGLPPDFRDRVLKYPNFFRVVVDEDERHVLELTNWDKNLAISALEREFLSNETKVRKTFRFSIPHRKELDLNEEEWRELDKVTTFPLISPYSDGSGLKPWSIEAEKYRIGLIHEFMSLTLEKRAWIHHIVEFKEELGLTRRTYDLLKKQHRAFYLAGTEMNWAVFLKDAYGENGILIEKCPYLEFIEKLQRYACMRETSEIVEVE